MASNDHTSPAGESTKPELAEKGTDSCTDVQKLHLPSKQVRMFKKKKNRREKGTVFSQPEIYQLWE